MDDWISLIREFDASVSNSLSRSCSIRRDIISSTLGWIMALLKFPVIQLGKPVVFGPNSKSFILPPREETRLLVKPLVIQAKGNARIESPKIRNRRMQRKFTGTPTRPRLSVFCSDKQLYAMLVDDQNRKCLFYGSTLQKSIRDNPPCTTVEASRRVGEELIKVCIDLDISEISTYDRNGFARGERIQAFEIAIAHHGFLPR
ncbi:50S ribosomal protein L18 isoform X2 [Rhodamnia argentea]|uniref:50S ribosomal protein L18 isoform X2 n=1 Tax=Rhodamnia argentea TaxID=178133 RepID=A0ABM3HJH9_9MYRT|nr:50S ribosomal protein L18 isoform X2 [Rhodamnia argentea]